MNTSNKVSILTCSSLLVAMTSLLVPGAAQAAAFKAIRIGDVDGFGYGSGQDYNAANGGAVNVDNQGMLGNGDFLPDLNGDGKLATYKGDDFDHRTAAEVGNALITGDGFEDKGSTGSQFTDVALSTSSRDALLGITPLREQKQELKVAKQSVKNELKVLRQSIKSSNSTLKPLKKAQRKLTRRTTKLQNKVVKFENKIVELEARNSPKLKAKKEQLVATQRKLADVKLELEGVATALQPLVEANDLLKSTRTSLQERKQSLTADITALDRKINGIRSENDLGGSRIPQPVFTFDFSVGDGDIVENSPFYLNLLFADYDVKDAEIKFTTANGSFVRQLTKQRNKLGYDGWIQSAFVELGFNEVFTATDNGFDGFVTAEVIAKDEPYLAFDFIELSASKIAIGTPQQPGASTPEPTTMLGILALGAFTTRHLKRANETETAA